MLRKKKIKARKIKKKFKKRECLLFCFSFLVFFEIKQRTLMFTVILHKMDKNSNNIFSRSASLGLICESQSILEKYVGDLYPIGSYSGFVSIQPSWLLGSSWLRWSLELYPSTSCTIWVGWTKALPWSTVNS